jgi:hypothetical protein
MVSSMDTASNPSTPIDLLSTLASDADDYVRAGVASNPSTPIDLLSTLASDFIVFVRRGVASNPSTPIDLLNTLASDANDSVREQIAGHPKTSPSLLMQLSKDSSYEVRLQIVARSDCPTDLFELFAKDKSKRVKEMLSNRGDLPANIRAVLDAQGFTTASKVLEDNQGQEISLSEITAVKVVRERANLVGKVTNPQTLLALAGDESATVRFQVVRNPVTPDQGLKKVLEACQGENWSGVNATIVSLVIEHPKAGEETLKLAAKMANGTNLAIFFEREPQIDFEMFLHVLSCSMSLGVTFAKVVKRNFILRSKEFTAENWKVFVIHTDARIRTLVAGNPNAPVEHFDVLALDSDSTVRAAVKANKKAPATARAAAALLG